MEFRTAKDFWDIELFFFFVFREERRMECVNKAGGKGSDLT